MFSTVSGVNVIALRRYGSGIRRLLGAPPGMIVLSLSRDLNPFHSK
jgi:hypothetical protein